MNVTFLVNQMTFNVNSALLHAANLHVIGT